MSARAISEASGKRILNSQLEANCGATCGDAVHQSGEGCDDGNDIETDSCLSSCVTAVCGDEITRADRAGDTH